MKSVNMSRNLWNTGTVSAENLPREKLGQIRMRIQIVDNVINILLHHSVSLNIIHCVHLSIFSWCIMIEKLAWC